MAEPCESYSNGFCVMFDESLPFEDLPAGCNEEGLCDDECNEDCDEYAEADEHCGDCGLKYENCECED